MLEGVSGPAELALVEQRDAVVVPAQHVFIVFGWRAAAGFS